MAEGGDDRHSGEDLVKQDLITREELAEAQEYEAHEYEAQSGTPWYKQLLQMRKVTFEAVEDVLRYEFHPKAVRAEHERLGSTLLEMELIAQKQLEEALAEQKRNGRLLGNILLERGIMFLPRLTPRRWRRAIPASAAGKRPPRARRVRSRNRPGDLRRHCGSPDGGPEGFLAGARAPLEAKLSEALAR